MSASKSILFIASLLSLACCDSSARSKAGALVPADGESRAYETCESSADCEGDLRCIASSCQSAQRSRLGDYYAALGRRLSDDPAAASRAYNLAITQYETENLEPPPDLLCEQGIALAAGREDSQLAEAGARILHKCILNVPLGSAPAMAAMDALASLSEAGLEEQLLTRSETADLYMTGEAIGPNLDDLKVSVTGDSSSRRRSYKGFLEALQTPAAKDKFVACWERYWKASKNEELNIRIELSYSFVLDEDDESRDRAVLNVSPQPQSDPELGQAQSCAEKSAEEIASEFTKGLRDDARWKSGFQIRVGS